MTGGPDWTQAKCHGTDIELWYQERQSSSTARANTKQAKAECVLCPIRAACLVEALKVEDGTGAESRHGIRAGLTGTQRYSLAKRLAESQTTPE